MKRSLRIWLSLAAALVLLFMTAIPAAAVLNDTYRIGEFGMSIKVPKDYAVITRDTPEDDPVFASLQLSYQDTMNDFEANHTYLRAYDRDGLFWISLTVTENDKSREIGNYADLSDGGRREILDAMLANPQLYGSSPTGVKYGAYYFFISSRVSTIGTEPLYINQCSTVVNGMYIDIALQKSGEEDITPSETKSLTAIASSIEFDKTESPASGPVFDWWRLLLWAAILAGLTIGISLLSKHRNEVRRRRLEERRRKRAEAAAPADLPDSAASGDGQLTFDEVLGYSDDDGFSSRAGADLDSFDISVREKDPARGVSYFEDGGKSIDDRSDDYFDTYFKEPTPARSGISRMFAVIGAYIGIFFRHIGYFFRNLFRAMTRKKKKQQE